MTTETSQLYDFLTPAVCPKLCEADRNLCEGGISKQECESALRGMINNKAPSVSGFSKEFFLHFWPELGDLVVNYINQARQDGVFFITQRRGVITLLPKKGDQKLIQNKRPICLLDIIYKIVAKVIANRMMSVIHKLVSSDQTGSMRGRYIGTNLRTIADVIYYASTDRLDGIIMALDFRNAFNSVEHTFVYSVLKEFNFGENFIGWVKLLYTSNELTVINNGFTSPWFRTGRGLQQGCPASGATFALVLEILAIKIRGERDVRGISVSGETFKSTQYCDDMTLFVQDSASADKAITLVREYGNISGLELNMNKCEFMWIGSQKASEQPICECQPVQKMKILGVWFSATENCAPINFEALEARVKVTFDQWSQRTLTLKGKITVAKSLIVSQMMYIMAATQVEEKQLAMIQSHIMSFLWRGRPPKVAKSTITMPVEKGGLNAPDLHLINKASRIAWIGKLIILKEATFVKVLHNRLHATLGNVINVAFDELWLTNRQIPEFYKEMLLWFRSICPAIAPGCGKTVRQQHLWHNKALLVADKTLCNRRLATAGITLIDDIVDAAGVVQSYEAFSIRHGIRINPLLYMGWCRSMPLRWRHLLAGSPSLSTEDRDEVLLVSLNGKDLSVSKVRSCLLYQAMVPERVPTAQSRWATEGIDFGADWCKVYDMPFRVTASTKLQSLQYRITHRYFPTRRFLFTRRIIDDPFCDNCGEVETMQHLFFKCSAVRPFWNDLIEAINVRRTTEISPTENEIMFGGSGYPAVLNLIIIVAKQFIANNRYRDSASSLQAFRPMLQKVFEMEKVTARKNGKCDLFRTKWSPFTHGGVLCL